VAIDMGRQRGWVLTWWELTWLGEVALWLFTSVASMVVGFKADMGRWHRQWWIWCWDGEMAAAQLGIIMISRVNDMNKSFMYLMGLPYHGSPFVLSWLPHSYPSTMLKNDQHLGSTRVGAGQL